MPKLRSPFSPQSHKPISKRAYTSVFITAAISFITIVFFSTTPLPQPFPFSTTIHLALQPPPDLPKCSRLIVFTGARQGSTWFIDSIESCKYSKFSAEKGSYDPDVYKKTELWKHFGEREHAGGQLDVQGVVDYINANGSVKIFPSVFWRKRVELMELINRRDEFRLNFVVLRRDVIAAWRSWVKAEESGLWNGETGSEGGDSSLFEGQYKYFMESRQRYDIGLDQMFGKAGLRFDVLDYDQVKEKRVIVLEKAGCWVENCNYLKV